MRFYRIQEGRITIDGKDIENYSVSDLRNHISIVMQEPMLFNQSIKDNILYGNSDATDAQVLNAAI